MRHEKETGKLTELLAVRFCWGLVRFFWTDLALLFLGGVLAMPFFSLVPFCFVGLFLVGLAAALLFSVFAFFLNFLIATFCLCCNDDFFSAVSLNFWPPATAAITLPSSTMLFSVLPT